MHTMLLPLDNVIVLELSTPSNTTRSPTSQAPDLKGEDSRG